MSGDGGKGSDRRPGQPGAYESGWDRVFGYREADVEALREAGQPELASAVERGELAVEHAP